MNPLPKEFPKIFSEQLLKNPNPNISTGISIFNLVRGVGCKNTLEIGLGDATSAVFLMAARNIANTGTHTAIDPFQLTANNDAGYNLIMSLPSSERFSLVRRNADIAFAGLAEKHARYDFIFFHNSFSFDTLFANFVLYSQLLATGGLMLFPSSLFSSVRSVLLYLRYNRVDFLESHLSKVDFPLFKKVQDINTRSWKEFKSFPIERE